MDEGGEDGVRDEGEREAQGGPARSRPALISPAVADGCAVDRRKDESSRAVQIGWWYTGRQARGRCDGSR